MFFRNKSCTTKNKSKCESFETLYAEDKTPNGVSTSLDEESDCSSENVCAITPVNGETSLSNGQCEVVTQFSENTESNTSNNNGIATKNTLEIYHDVQRSESEQSLAIPEGLVMDPLAPTALAVSTEFMDRIGSGLTLLRDHGKKVQKYVWKNKKFDILRKSWKSIVNIVLIEAKDLPSGPAGNLYCKFRLGNETHKSKQVSKTKPLWCERFNIHLYEESLLEVTLWHKGKEKHFMGRCSIDLNLLEKDKTQDLWQELECGYGSVHLLVTVNRSSRNVIADNIPTTTRVHIPPAPRQYSLYRLGSNMEDVGTLSVTVHEARGLTSVRLGGKTQAYCVLELHNWRVETQTISGTEDPTWSKQYTFAVKDITSTLNVTIFDDSPFKEVLGRVSIPLLRIENNESRWYALKNSSQKANAKGKCPRILLQMSLVWDPIKASLRVLRPKETIYTEKKENKFNIPMIYYNLKFIKDIFSAVTLANEHFKELFEWENRQLSTVALITWLTFWFYFQLWMTPLLLLMPFFYYWNVKARALSSTQLLSSEEDNVEVELTKDDTTLKNRLYGLQDLTLTIKNGIDFIVSLLERVQNLANFSVPYLSYLAIIALVALSAAFYFIHVNYLFMAFGIYKYGRKALNPERKPNNDILDFLSRVPDNEIMKQWKELEVPEPRTTSENDMEVLKEQ